MEGIPARKRILRAKIASQIDDFLASGKKIQRLDACIRRDLCMVGKGRKRGGSVEAV